MNNSQKLQAFILHSPSKPVQFWEVVRLAQELDKEVVIIEDFCPDMLEFNFTDLSTTSVKYRELP